jgi:SAM-dependent methyltransferase
MLRTIIRSLLAHPLARHFDLDSTEAATLRAKIIQEKAFLKKFYIECYLSISSSLPADVSGPVVELGSGGGFFKEYNQSLVTSEILQLPFVDVVLDGQRLPFRDNSLRAIVMLDVFHHLPSVVTFVTEAARCIKPGGSMVMIEPWNTPWSRFVYRNLHHELFDPNAIEWEFCMGGPLSQANQALPWIVFKRDQKIFEQRFSQWEIDEICLQTPFCYLLSGGVSFRSFMPGFLYRSCRRIENLFQPWIDSWAMFAKIVLSLKD